MYIFICLANFTDKMGVGVGVWVKPCCSVWIIFSRYLRVCLRVLLDVSALLLEPFSRERVVGLRGLSLVVQGSFWGVSSEWISPIRPLGGLGVSGSLGYLWLKITVMRLTSRPSLFRENWALSIRSLSLLACCCQDWWWGPSLRNYSLKQINNIYTHMVYFIYICAYLFAPSRGQPLCFSLWISNSATLGKIKTFQCLIF